jgi:hypothetical protein
MKHLILPAAIFAATVTANVAATAQKPNEISAYVAGGLSSLKYREGKSGFGGAIGAGYTYYFNDFLGAFGGLEVGLSSANISTALADEGRKLYSDASRNEEFDFRFSAKGYKEKHSAVYLSVPLMAQYRTEISNLFEFYAAGGLKVGFSVSGSYSATIDEVKTSGYFPATEQLFEDMPAHGFSTYKNISSTGKYSFRMNVSPVVEAGVRYRLNDDFAIHAGIYIAYGLTDASPSKSNALPVDYRDDTSAKIAYPGILQAQGDNGKNYTGKINLFSTGLKITVSRVIR